MKMRSGYLQIYYPPIYYIPQISQLTQMTQISQRLITGELTAINFLCYYFLKT